MFLFGSGWVGIFYDHEDVFLSFSTWAPARGGISWKKISVAHPPHSSQHYLCAPHDSSGQTKPIASKSVGILAQGVVLKCPCIAHNGHTQLLCPLRRGRPLEELSRRRELWGILLPRERQIFWIVKRITGTGWLLARLAERAALSAWLSPPS
jgi:hypothetical protein